MYSIDEAMSCEIAEVACMSDPAIGELLTSCASDQLHDRSFLSLGVAGKVDRGRPCGALVKLF